MTRFWLLKVHSNFYLEYDAIMKYISQIWFGLDFEIPSYELGYLCWDGYPLYFLPSNFDGDNPTNELQSVAT